MNINWVVNGYAYGLKISNPSTSDINYPISYIWINLTSNVAYILVSKIDGIAVWNIKNPDSIYSADTGFQVNMIGSTSLLDINTPRTDLPANIVVSEPGVGEFRVTKLRMDENKKLVATYEE